MKILPVFISHLGCPFKCVYCNQFSITHSVKPDFEKIKYQIEQFSNNEEKKEVAFFGGTFTGLSKEMQKTLLNLVNIPNTSVRISTRPDFISEEILQYLKKKNVTTIELGIQSFYDEVLLKSSRGYNSETAVTACKLIKKHNFNLSIQLMPGLPFFSDESLKYSIEKTVELQPEYVRIYPTIVLKNTGLAKMYLDGKYTPLSLEKAIEIVAKMIEIFDKNDINVIKSGLHSDIQGVIAGPYHPSFGELVRIENYYKKLITEYNKKMSLVISNKDISLFKGFSSMMINKIKDNFKINKIPMIIKPNLNKNEFYFSAEKPDIVW